MKRRILSMLLAILMVLTISGCGKKDEDKFFYEKVDHGIKILRGNFETFIEFVYICGERSCKAYDSAAAGGICDIS